MTALQITISTHPDFWGDDPTQNDINGFKQEIRKVAAQQRLPVEFTETTADELEDLNRLLDEIADQEWVDIQAENYPEMFNDPLVDGCETQEEFNAEIEAEAASSFPLMCECGELYQDCDCN